MTRTKILEEHEALAGAIRAAEHRILALHHAMADATDGFFVVGWLDGTAVAAGGEAIVGVAAALVSDQSRAELFRRLLADKDPEKFGMVEVIPYARALVFAIEIEEAGLLCMRSVLGQMLRMAGVPAASIIRRGGL